MTDYVVRHRLWITADGRAVPDGHSNAAFLLAAGAGDFVSASVAEKYHLREVEAGLDPKPTPHTTDPTAATPLPHAEGKAIKPAEDKAQPAPTKAAQAGRPGGRGR